MGRAGLVNEDPQATREELARRDRLADEASPEQPDLAVSGS